MKFFVSNKRNFSEVFGNVTCAIAMIKNDEKTKWCVIRYKE